MKTKRIRIAVAVSEVEWCARGSSHNLSHDALAGLRTIGTNQHIVWVEADVPLPPDPAEEIVVQGRVK